MSPHPTTAVNTPRLPTEARRATIVAAALERAGRCSPAQITTADIAVTVGVTQGALFKHFATKEAIWLAVMEWVHARLLERLEAAAGRAATPQQALAAVFHAHVAFVIEHPGAPRVIFHELQQPDDSAVKQAVRQLLQHYRGLVRRCLEAATSGAVPAAAADADIDPALDRDAAATLFIGIVQGLVMQALIGGRPETLATQADAVFTLYLRSLRPPS